MASDKINIAGERIRGLYEDHGYSQKEFADFLGISTAQLRRYEKDPDQPIRSDLLITMAKHFHVSVDYILGLTPVTKNNHEMEYLHLTGTACEKLIRGEVCGDTLSRIMAHEKFGELIKEIEYYLNGSHAGLIAVQNEMAAFGASLFRRRADKTEHPDIVHAAADGLTASIANAETVQLDDITLLLDTILKETKSRLDQAHPTFPEKPASAVTVSKIIAIVEEASLQEHMTRDEQIDYSADRIVDTISAETGLNDPVLRLLKSVFRLILRNSGKDKS